MYLLVLHGLVQVTEESLIYQSTSRGRSQSVSRSQPSSHAVKLFAVKELEDDLTDLRV